MRKYIVYERDGKIAIIILSANKKIGRIVYSELDEFDENDEYCILTKSKSKEYKINIREPTEIELEKMIERNI